MINYDLKTIHNFCHKKLINFKNINTISNNNKILIEYLEKLSIKYPKCDNKYKKKIRALKYITGNNIKNINIYRNKSLEYFKKLNYIEREIILAWTSFSDTFNKYISTGEIIVTDQIKKLKEQYYPYATTYEAVVKKIVNILKDIIKNSPKTTSDLYIYRFFRPPTDYELSSNVKKQFISFTLTPFGSDDFQDLSTVRYFHKWNSCCISIAKLPKGSNCLLIPPNYSCCAVDEIVLPPGVKYTNIINHNKYTYEYSPIVSYFEYKINKCANIIFSSCNSKDWTNIKNVKNNPMRTLYKYNKNIKISIKTYSYIILQ